MPFRVDKHGDSLLASAPPGYTIRRINGVAYGAELPADFPVSVPLAAGHVTVLDAGTGQVVFVEPSSNAQRPPDKGQMELGSFTFTLWNGVSEMAEQTCTVTASGTLHPPAAVMNGEAIIRASGDIVTHS